MRGNFGNFCCKMTLLVANKVLSVDHLKSFVERSYPELKPKLANATSLKIVVDIVEDECTIINIAAVEDIVEFYDITEAKELIAEYNKSVDEFCSQMKLEFMLDKSLSSSHASLTCEKIEFVLEWDPTEHSLNDIRHLLEKAFEDTKKRVIVRTIRRGNSIIVTCYAPHHLMDALLLEVQANLPVLQEEFSLIRLTIGHYSVYDRSIKDKVCNN